jgi:hypothetical protein
MSAWQELIIEGPEQVVRAFVVGVAAGRGLASAGVFGHDCDLVPESLGERLKTLLSGGSHHVLLAAEELAAPLSAALARNGAEVGLRLDGRRQVSALRFSFRVEVFSRDLAREIRADLLSSLPAAVKIENLSEGDESHPEAHGAELYAPLHAYVYRASGVFVGQPAEILPLRRRARERDFVTVGGIEVEGTPANLALAGGLE